MPRPAPALQGPNRPRPPDPELLSVSQRHRRDRIVEAAVELMMTQPYETVQMKDVTARAGVALGTVYRYFTSKDHVFSEGLLAWSERYEGASDRTGTGTSLARLKTAYRRAVRAFERYPTVYGYLVAIDACDDASAGALFARFASRQSDAFAAALPRVRSPRRDRIIDVMSSVLDTNLRAWSQGRRSIAEVHSAIDHAAELLLDAP